VFAGLNNQNWSAVDVQMLVEIRLASGKLRLHIFLGEVVRSTAAINQSFTCDAGRHVMLLNQANISRLPPALMQTAQQC